MSLIPIELNLLKKVDYINPNSLDNKGSWRILKDFVLFSNNAEGVRVNEKL